MGQPPIRIVYLLGAARSGSTILSAILGRHSDVAAVGELARLTFDVEGATRICGCGERVWECEKWHAVREAWLPRIAPWTLEDYTSRISKYMRFFRTPRLFLDAKRASSELPMLLKSTAALMNAIRSSFGSSILVDSSKIISRAMLYSMIPNIDLRIVHLIRDPRGYVWSRQKKRTGAHESQSVPLTYAAQTAIHWNLVNLSSEWQGRGRRIRRLRMRYEDLIAKPRESLTSIGELIGINFEPVIRQIEEERKIGFGHIVAGNLIRLAGPVNIELDESWRAEFAKNPQRLAWLCGLPLSGIYGYSPA